MPQTYKTVNRAVGFIDFKNNCQNARDGDPNWYKAMSKKWNELTNDDVRLSLFNQKLLQQEIKNKAVKVEKLKTKFASFFGKKDSISLSAYDLCLYLIALIVNKLPTFSGTLNKKI